jgi:hypothetical protein
LFCPPPETPAPVGYDFATIYSRFASSFTPTESNSRESVSGLVHGKEARISMTTRMTQCREGLYSQIQVTLTYGGHHYTDIPSQELALTVYNFIAKAQDTLYQSQHNADKADKAMFNATFCA